MGGLFRWWVTWGKKVADFCGSTPKPTYTLFFGWAEMRVRVHVYAHMCVCVRIVMYILCVFSGYSVGNICKLLILLGFKNTHISPH